MTAHAHPVGDEGDCYAVINDGRVQPGRFSFVEAQTIAGAINTQERHTLYRIETSRAGFGWDVLSYAHTLADAIYELLECDPASCRRVMVGSFVFASLDAGEAWRVGAA